MIVKGGVLIEEADSRVVLTSSPQFDTRGVKFSTMSGESLLEAREEERCKKEGICQ